MPPLDGLLILDFSSLLPGPMAAMWLGEAGARVIKIERPGVGDEMRHSGPVVGDTSVYFRYLNSDKETLVLDLKAAASLSKLEPLLRDADVLIEQFRPGVMAKFGLGYDRISKINPGLIYCSITGYGQFGPKAMVAGHDLNYEADAGMLSLLEPPSLPTVPIADIGGGTYPAVVNILLALLQRAQTGKGIHLDIAMTDNLFPWMFAFLGKVQGTGRWPQPSAEAPTGGSPRYNIYRTKDGRDLAVAAVEDRFWSKFLELLGLDMTDLGTPAEPSAIIHKVQKRVAQESAEHWRSVFEGQDACCNIVSTFKEVLDDPYFKAKGLFDRTVGFGPDQVSALPSPIAPALRRRSPTRRHSSS